ncbi:MAG: hypothetical protein IPH59_16080 [bacterium]|nr:hypothetical protein [bacterium]
MGKKNTKGEGSREPAKAASQRVKACPMCGAEIPQSARSCRFCAHQMGEAARIASWGNLFLTPLASLATVIMAALTLVIVCDTSEQFRQQQVLVQSQVAANRPDISITCEGEEIYPSWIDSLGSYGRVLSICLNIANNGKSRADSCIIVVRPTIVRILKNMPLDSKGRAVELGDFHVSQLYVDPLSPNAKQSPCISLGEVASRILQVPGVNFAEITFELTFDVFWAAGTLLESTNQLYTLIWGQSSETT